MKLLFLDYSRINNLPPKKNLKLSSVRLRRISEFSRGFSSPSAATKCVRTNSRILHKGFEVTEGDRSSVPNLFWCGVWRKRQGLHFFRGTAGGVKNLTFLKNRGILLA